LQWWLELAEQLESAEKPTPARAGRRGACPKRTSFLLWHCQSLQIKLEAALILTFIAKSTCNASEPYISESN
jgi:hypothetical protein